MSELLGPAISHSPTGKLQEHSHVLDYDLNYRINKIIGKIPESIKQNIYEQISQPSPSKLSAPLGTYKSTYSSANGNQDYNLPKTNKILTMVSSTVDSNKILDLKSKESENSAVVFQQKLWDRKKEEERLLQSRLGSEKPPLSNLAAEMNTINFRMEKAIQSSREVTKKFDENISDFVSKYLDPPSTKETQYKKADKAKLFTQQEFESPRIHEFVLNTQPLADTQKVSPSSQFHISQSKTYSSPQPYQRSVKNIDVIFDETIRRSEALLQQNQEFDKKYSQNPFYKAKKTLENLEGSGSPKKSYLDSGIGITTEKVYKSPAKTQFEPSLLSGSAFSKGSPISTGRTERFQRTKIREKKHGKGTIEFEDGSKYTGEWEDGLRNGFGVKELPNGEVEYEGEWQDDKYNGTGCLINTDPKKIDGDFDYNDFGKLGGVWVKYEGGFDIGRSHGLGTLYLSNGEKFRGKFKFGEVHGAGTYTQRSGTMITGEWRENKFTGPL